MTVPRISFVVPVRDEADNVVALYDEIAGVMGEVGVEWEVIFIDDGSTDGTFDRLRELHAKHAPVRVIRFTRNFGKSSGLSVGFAAARGSIIITLDGDLQDDPREIPRFLEALDQGFDLVSGWKRKRRDPVGKRVASRIFNWTMARLTGLRLHDVNCGFKAYRAEVARGLRLRHGLHRFIPFLAQAKGYRIGEIVVAHRERVHGRSKYGWERIPQAVVDVHLAWLVARGVEHPRRILIPAGAGLLVAGGALSAFAPVGPAAAKWPLLVSGAIVGLAGCDLLVMAALTGRAMAREPAGGAYAIAERLD